MMCFGMFFHACCFALQARVCPSPKLGAFSDQQSDQSVITMHQRSMVDMLGWSCNYVMIVVRIRGSICLQECFQVVDLYTVCYCLELADQAN